MHQLPVVGGGVIKKRHLHGCYEVNSLTIGVFRQLHDAEWSFGRRRGDAKVFLRLGRDRADIDRQIKRNLFTYVKSAVVTEPVASARIGANLGKNDVIRVRIAVEQGNWVIMGVLIYIITNRTKEFRVISLAQSYLERLQVIRQAIIVEGSIEGKLAGVQAGHQGHGFIG